MDQAIRFCGQGNETVEHVLLRCTQWTNFRDKLKVEAGQRCNDLSSLLEGYSRRREPRTGKPVDGLI